jgi:phosphatidate phosphatase APP1
MSERDEPIDEAGGDLGDGLRDGVEGGASGDASDNLTAGSDERAINLVLFRGYGTPARLVFSGRALHNAPDVTLAADADAGVAPTTGRRAGLLRNLAASFNRLESDEAANVLLRAEYGGEVWEAISDDEGYFAFVLEPAGPPATTEAWQEVTVRWVDVQADRSGPPVTALVLTPPTSAFGVISDVDDTVLASHITSIFKMALEMLLKDVHGRATFPGVPEFYRALQGGPNGQADNPIFYVSLSPWNFYGLIEQFLALNGIPAGPVLLRDYGLHMLAALRGPSPKLRLIQEVLDTYPALPFVLLGDSGQHDPEIYAEIVRANPGRILAVYIRDVSEGRDAGRRAEVEALAAETNAAGVDMLLSHETAVFAAHAERKELIAAAQAGDETTA